MTRYCISIDQSLCSGFGACVDLAPDLFRLERGGIAEAVTAETDDASVIDAAAACPMGAIAVREEVAA